ncbi:MAG: hypothetical protein IKD73_08395 [Selenomonadaceae bacterium]|nr:hypothetical protein [Selenomonadaceae bacterium]
MNIKETICGAFGTAVAATGTALQPNDVLQTISLVITIIGGLITFIFVPFYNWWKQAKKDGKITKEELKDGVEIAVDGANKFKSQIEMNDKREDIKRKEGK